MIREEIALTTNDLVSLSHRMESSDLIFDDIRMLLVPLKYRSVCLSQEMDTRLPSRPAMNRKMDISTDDKGPAQPLALMLDSHQQPFTLPIPKHSLLCYFTSSYWGEGRPALSFHYIRFSSSISRPMRNPSQQLGL